MKKIINCTTGKIVERELNADELAQQEIDEAAFQAAEIIRLTKAEAQAKAKAAAEAKLAALGLTADDLKALGLS